MAGLSLTKDNESVEPQPNSSAPQPMRFTACVILLAAPRLGDVYRDMAMVTGFGGTRIVDMLAGEQLPRIC